MRWMLLIAVAAFSVNCHASELAEREAVRVESGSLFLASDFEQLESLATSYRDESTRTTNGTWKLAMFYEGIAMKGLSYEKGEQRQWRKALTQFDDWLEKYPDSSTPHIAKATALMERGWALRGSGYVQGVNKVYLLMYQALARETREYLMQHDALKFEDPHWYALMGSSYQALGVARKEFWELYTEGLELHPNYDPFIFIAANYYSPRWYGSHNAIERLARYTAEATEDTRDFAPYARIYWVAGFDSDAQRFAFQLPQANWNDMVRGMDAVIERYPGQWNMNHFGYFACYARNREVAARIIRLVTEPIVRSAWVSEQNYQTCRLIAGLDPTPKTPLP